MEYDRHTSLNTFQKDAKEDACDVRVEVESRVPTGPGDDKMCYVSSKLSMSG